MAGVVGISQDRQYFTPDQRTPRIARGFVAHACGGLPRDVRDVVLLLTSELVTNAVVHAAGPIVVEVVRGDDYVRVEVFDSGQAVPRRVGPALYDEAGRGLAIVDSLADRWGATIAADRPGKSVWFELHTAGAG